jgi:hypothetical protein
MWVSAVGGVSRPLAQSSVHRAYLRGIMRRITDEDLMKIRFSLEELERVYRDRRRREPTRHLAFGRYWFQWLEERGSLTRSDLERMLEHSEWEYEIGNVVKILCQDGLLTPLDAEWLAKRLRPGSFGLVQVEAYLTLLDQGKGWLDKLQLLLEMRALWAAGQAVDALPLEEAARRQCH